MVRDWKAEKRIHFVSWLTWKLNAIIMVIAIIGLALYSYFAGKMPGGGPKEPIMLIGMGVLYFVFGLFYWAIGKALDRFRSWARWFTVFLYGVSILVMVGYMLFFGLTFFQGLKNGFKWGPQTIIPLVTILIYGVMCLFYGYCLKCLVDQHAKKVFSKDYQYRLKHGSFDKIKVNPLESGQESDTLQKAALFFIIFMVVVAVIGIIAAIAIPNLLASRKAANEASAIGTLRATFSAQMQFRILRKAGSRYAESYEELNKHQLLTLPASGIKNGYRFKMKITQGGQGFEAVAVPVKQGATGDRGFFVSDRGSITYSRDGSEPNAKSPAID